MASHIDPAPFREELLRRLAELRQLTTDHADASAVVQLDQSKVGRLSRMDALQGQAISREARRRRELAIAAISAALKRMDAGDYGYCRACGEEVDPRRLTADPAVALCVGCAARAENS